MTLVTWLLGALVACGWFYWAIAAYAAERWRRTRSASPSGLPGVSVLKPLCGAEPELFDNLASFCTQNYPEYEVLFVAEEPDDPALLTAHKVAKTYPDCAVRILSGSPGIGANRKVRNLLHAATVARHSILVISDSDMRVGTEYLSSIVAPFSDPSVGLATCLYRSRDPKGLASVIEALGIGADFIPSVLVAWLLCGPKFGFGSTIAIRRAVLENAGGFEAVADELADDYRLCEMARATGARQVLSQYVVDYVPGCQSLGAVWARRVRWGRTIRVLQPAGAIGSVVTNILVSSMALACATRTPAAFAVVGVSLAWRATCAWWIAFRCTHDASVVRFLWLLTIHDVFSFGVWLASLSTRRVQWRGRQLRVAGGGKLRDS